MPHSGQPPSVDTGTARLYVLDGINIIEKYRSGKVTGEDEKQIVETLEAQFETWRPAIVWKRAHYVLAPEAMKIVADFSKIYRGPLLIAGSDAEPRPDNNFAGSTYLAAKKPLFFTSLEEALEEAMILLREGQAEARTR